MSADREHELTELLRERRDTEPMRMLSELLTLRRERCRDKLENRDDSEVRGQAKECKFLIEKIFE